MNALIIIPARINSTRLPCKLLLAETSKPLIQHTYERAKLVTNNVIIATDSPEITQVCKSFGAKVIQTGEHTNGTDRMAEAVENLNDNQFDIFVNVQADEPEIEPELINKIIHLLQTHPDLDCTTAATSEKGHNNNPNRVKVWLRDFGVVGGFGRNLQNQFIHIGIYAYRREALKRYAATGPCPQEIVESLEQLRALHIGLRMGVVMVEKHSAGIDTRDDYDAFVKRQRNAK